MKLCDEKYFEDFKKGWEDSRKQLESEQQSIKQVILLTHMGPFYSQTSVVVDEGNYVYQGSKYLDEFIKKNDNILLNIHGHSHNGEGISKVGNTSVINPGTLLNGKFATIRIKRNFNNVWKIEKVEMINLDL